jgi:CDP-diacylglycerol--serine O-phosphatidyltransferase
MAGAQWRGASNGLDRWTVGAILCAVANGISSRRRSLPPHFSLVRSLTTADFITLINAVSGVSAVFSCLEFGISRRVGYLWAAIGLIVLAALADFFDGRVARRTRRMSSLGGDLDSLADLISFGVAPAALAFSIGLNGVWDWIVLVYFVCCGLSRLARYNVTAGSLADTSGKVAYFEGTPIPTSLILVLGVAALIAAGRIQQNLPLGVWRGLGEFHPVVLVYLVSGSAMISARLRVPKP